MSNISLRVSCWLIQEDLNTVPPFHSSPSEYQPRIYEYNYCKTSYFFSAIHSLDPFDSQQSIEYRYTPKNSCTDQL